MRGELTDFPSVRVTTTGASQRHSHAGVRTCQRRISLLIWFDLLLVQVIRKRPSIISKMLKQTETVLYVYSKIQIVKRLSVKHWWSSINQNTNHSPVLLLVNEMFSSIQCQNFDPTVIFLRTVLVLVRSLLDLVLEVAGTQIENQNWNKQVDDEKTMCWRKDKKQNLFDFGV